MNCSTCNNGRNFTTFALVPELSGKPIDEAVAQLGPALCSVCFPSAPTEWLDGTKVPARVATVLAEQGQEAFDAELAKYTAAKNARESSKCAGSGATAIEINWRAYPSARGRCSACGASVVVNTNSTARQHKPRVAKN